MYGIFYFFLFCYVENVYTFHNKRFKKLVKNEKINRNNDLYQFPAVRSKLHYPATKSRAECVRFTPFVRYYYRRTACRVPLCTTLSRLPLLSTGLPAKSTFSASAVLAPSFVRWRTESLIHRLNP